jgi:uncharacterized protein
MKVTLLIAALMMWNGSVHAQGANKMSTAEEVIKKLNLQPLPDEGGYFRETYKSDIEMPADEFGLQSESVANRKLTTAIYYLVTPTSFSALHKLKSDEVFHFYSGDAVEMIQIDPSGKLTRYELGPDVARGQTPQVVVPRGSWQALRLKKGGDWGLMGTTVAPGFEFEDFELGIREDLIKSFPHLRVDIIRFTREPGERVH